LSEFFLLWVIEGESGARFTGDEGGDDGVDVGGAGDDFGDDGVGGDRGVGVDDVSDGSWRCGGSASGVV
jgi:hypothetical protein